MQHEWFARIDGVTEVTPARESKPVNRLRRRRNMLEAAAESWQPPPHNSSTTGRERLISAMRRFFDLQSASIWLDVSAELPAARGMVLDVGCGAQPFRQLLAPEVRYVGIDT